MNQIFVGAQPLGGIRMNSMVPHPRSSPPRCLYPRSNRRTRASRHPCPAPALPRSLSDGGAAANSRVRTSARSARGYREDLHFDVTRRQDVFLDQYAIITERRPLPRAGTTQGPRRNPTHPRRAACPSRRRRRRLLMSTGYPMAEASLFKRFRVLLRPKVSWGHGHMGAHHQRPWPHPSIPSHESRPAELRPR